MPAFGGEKILTPHQIADVISCVQSINAKKSLAMSGGFRGPPWSS